MGAPDIRNPTGGPRSGNSGLFVSTREFGDDAQFEAVLRICRPLVRSTKREIETIRT